eukprot:scaffold214409_cov33-Tisochrysis_lutea.AAC.6
MESSPSNATQSVGVSGLRPESVTSSTVSPIERTKVALTKLTTIKAWCSSERWRFTVQTCSSSRRWAVGLGSGIEDERDALLRRTRVHAVP